MIAPQNFTPVPVYKTEIPSFSWKDEIGKIHSTKELAGQSILIILFSLNCNHCMNMLNHISGAFKLLPPEIQILCIGRNHHQDELTDFFKEEKMRLTVIADLEARIYHKFAVKGIPRIYLYDEHGKLQFQSRGFREDEMNLLVKTMQRSG